MWTDAGSYSVLTLFGVIEMWMLCDFLSSGHPMTQIIAAKIVYLCPHTHTRTRNFRCGASAEAKLVDFPAQAVSIHHRMGGLHLPAELQRQLTKITVKLCADIVQLKSGFSAETVLVINGGITQML